jgi:copper chaperone CopZ
VSEVRKLKLKIEGIHCAHCADDLIEGTLLNLPGIIEAGYDSAGALLTTTYKGNTISENEVSKLVESWGYEMSAHGAQVPRSRRRYQVVSLLVAATLLALFIWWMRSI